ncbi:mitotic spindle assembly checkpoint protein MAD1 isoform X2 [Photinus pyralis]|uniref:mitotic spindle assembly checkpoint protein MAD1 isoform X2 n=1 Tax=Photinus pyralis TaxID=7054 RepID=UPI001267219F|nr:mitotic spindle assembly checkpoint protein MAD1 isoform X2 [Photinus pyralis]
MTTATEGTKSIDDTLIAMITTLKPIIKSDMKSLDCETPLKRPLSTGIFDYVTPAKKMKQDTVDQYIGSPRETRRLRADLIESRNSILSLENRIKHMHTVRQETQIMFDAELRSLQHQHEYDRKSITDLEEQLQSVRKRESVVKTELTELKAKYDNLKIDTDKRIEELEKQLADFKADNIIEMDAKNEIITNLRSRNLELETFLKTVEEDSEGHKKLSSELEKRLMEKSEVERNLELKDQAWQRARLELKDLEYIRENYLEYQQQIKTHQHKLLAYDELEKENQHLKDETKRLKDAVHNKLILEEEVYDLKNRLSNYKEQEKKLSALQVAQVQSELYLNEWRSVARGICETTGSDATLPHLLRSVVEHLQQQELTLTEMKVQLESQLNVTTHDAKVARSELEKCQNLISDLQASDQHKQNLIRRMQKKLLLVSRERDSYRLQLDSYERDLTMTVSSANAAQGGVQQSQRDRIENLERIVDGYRDMVSKLESDLQKSEPTINRETIPIRVEQMSRLQDEIDHLKMDNDHLREQRDNLEIQLEKLSDPGNDVNSGRIVHLTRNPLAEQIQQHENELESLKETNERLKRKIINLKEGLEASKLDLTMNPKEINALKEQLKSSESQVQRLKDYFKSSMQEFRNVVYMLLGYKIDKNSNSQYKLTSMYAEQQEDQICFQLNAEGALNLLENEFSMTLEDMVDLHLRHQKSIPVFLSAITMDLFNNRTMATKTFEIDDD